MSRRHIWAKTICNAFSQKYVNLRLIPALIVIQYTLIYSSSLYCLLGLCVIINCIRCFSSMGCYTKLNMVYLNVDHQGSVITHSRSVQFRVNLGSVISHLTSFCCIHGIRITIIIVVLQSNTVSIRVFNLCVFILGH